MPKKIKSVLRIFVVLIGAVLVFAAGFVGFLTITEYRPEPEKTVPVSINGGLEPKKDVLGEKIRVLTFNIGYCNLGKESDFFMDGGENVRNGDKELVLKNFEGITDILHEADADIYFLQEVDNGSTRSFNFDEKTEITKELTGFRTAWAANYACRFVPFPWPPIGTVRSGIMTFSELNMEVGNRISLPCPFSWPVSAANLKRCLLVTYTDIEGTDKQLVTVNLHLEAYDDGEGKIAQTKMLWEVLEEEYAKGNYVIAGGDFNQTFSNVDRDLYPSNATLWTPGAIDVKEFGNKWNLVMDPTNPTCRSLDQPLAGADKENFQYYMIDGFILSKNITINSYDIRDLGFANSDHNPQVLNITLN